MSASVPTDAEIRSAAVEVATELTTLIATWGNTTRLAWARAHAGWATFGDDNLTTALGYLLAHRISRDLAASQGSTSAPVGGGGVAGALTSVATGGVSLGFGASGVVSAVNNYSLADAELALSPYGLAFLSLRETVTGGLVVRNAPASSTRGVW